MILKIIIQMMFMWTLIIGSLSIESTPVKETPKPRPKPTPVKIITRQTFKWVEVGKATWYNVGRGFYGAAGPALRVGNWRGRVVRVCTTNRCVFVKLVDWCACGNGRLIDLGPDAFSSLYPLSKGVGSVIVKW